MPKMFLEGTVQKVAPVSRTYDGKVKHQVELYVFDGQATTRVKATVEDEAAAVKFAAKYKPGQEVRVPTLVDVWNGRLTMRVLES